MERNGIQGKEYENPPEFTLEDTYEHLKDIREEITREMEKLMHSFSNNKTYTITDDITEDSINARCCKLLNGLFTSYSRMDLLRELPIPNSKDLYQKMILEIETVLDQMRQLQTKTEAAIGNTHKHCSHLRRDIEGLVMMRDGCLRGIKNYHSETNVLEIGASLKLFRECKNDLFAVVDAMFPNNIGSKEVLAALTKAYTKGGDDVYIDFEPESLQFVNFLINANVASYHRNDKSRIKLTDLL